MSTDTATTPPVGRAAQRRRASRTFLSLALWAAVLYGGGIAMGTFLEGTPALIGAAVLICGAAVLWAVGSLTMYRMADEFERAKIAEAVMFAFVVATPLILAVGALQFFGLPQLSWIFAFSILMVAWAVGTVVAAVRHR